MILLDGKKIADRILAELKEEIAEKKWKLRLGVVLVGHDSVSEDYVKLKQRIGASIGVEVRIYPIEEEELRSETGGLSNNKLRERLNAIVAEEKNDGVIVQLPLPCGLDTQRAVNAIVPRKDVDLLSAYSIGKLATGKSDILPPVAGAVKLLFEDQKWDLWGRHWVMMGAGKLVGRAMAHMLEGEISHIEHLMRNEANADERARMRRHYNLSYTVLQGENPEQHYPLLKMADVIVSGIGCARCITGDMIKDGAIMIDVGASKVNGKLVGDVDTASVADKASALSSDKGGVGPLTIALLFRNLLTLASLKRH